MGGGGTHLLFCVSTSSRPFGDNILSRLIVGRKSECDTRKSCTKINSYNKRSLAPPRALDFVSGVRSEPVRGRPRWQSPTHPNRLLLLHAIDGRSAQGLLPGIRHVGVQRVRHLLPASGGHGAGWPPSYRIIGVARRLAHLILVVHRKTGF